ncbi:MAG: hypothetical protein KGI79_03275 [Patescibacteria group bacterium]|nr:hypothetical protein [Patescibacteria group bacterium]MDE2116869.1 hypothetical protein [Patescibacteria group bacterium]
MKTKITFLAIALVGVMLSGCATSRRVGNLILPPPPGTGQVVLLGNQAYESPGWSPFGAHICGTNDSIIVHNQTPYGATLSEQGTPRMVIPAGGSVNFHPSSGGFRNAEVDIAVTVAGPDRQCLYDQVVRVNSASQGPLTASWIIGMQGQSFNYEYAGTSY